MIVRPALRVRRCTPKPIRNVVCIPHGVGRGTTIYTNSKGGSNRNSPETIPSSNHRLIHQIQSDSSLHQHNLTSANHQLIHGSTMNASTLCLSL